MKKLIIILSLTTIGLSSCAKEWSEADQNLFLEDCLQYAVDGQEDICSCGLEKAMESYSSLQEAQEAIDNMSEEEFVEFFAGCL